MKQVSKTLGLVGGIGGTVLSVLILFIIWIRQVFGRTRFERLATGISVWNIFVLIFAIIGIVGAALVTSKPKSGGILMLISGAGGIIAVIISTAVAGRFSAVDLIEAAFALLLLLSGIFGLISPPPQKADAQS